MEKNNLYVIVVTFNGEAWIRKCLASVLSSGVKVKIIVIDNFSTDNTKSIIKSEFPSISLIENWANIGFGQANNQGFNIALRENADYIFLLNQDAWITPNSLTKLLDILIRNKSYGILSPLQLNPNNNRIEEQFSTFISTNHEILSDILAKSVKEVYEVNFINAASWLITRKCLEIVGGFDPIFFHYGEDNDYCQRAVYHGFKIGVCPGVSIYHDKKYAKVLDFTQEFKLNFNYHLLEIKDISKNFLKIYLKNLFHLVSEIIKTIFGFRKFYKLFLNLILFFKLLIYFNKIHKSRKKTKKHGSYLI